MRRFGAHYAHKRRYLPDAAQLLSLCSGMSRTKQSSASFNLEWDENKLWEQQRQQHNWFGYRVITGIRFQTLHVYSQRTSKCRLNKSPEAVKRKVNWSTSQSTTERKQSAPSFTTTSSCPNLPRMLLSNCLWRFIRWFLCCHFSCAVILWEPRRSIILFSLLLIASDPEKWDAPRPQKADISSTFSALN